MAGLRLSHRSADAGRPSGIGVAGSEWVGGSGALSKAPSAAGGGPGPAETSNRLALVRTDGRLPVPGTFNFRDLGGLAANGGVVRPRMLMRSDALVSLGVPGRAALADLGVRTAVDLREPVERRLDPPDLQDIDLAHHTRPLFGNAIDLRRRSGLAELYEQVLDACGGRVAGIVELLAADDGLPAVIFCSAGKDRTGLVCGLLLSALGVDDDAVADEYALTGLVLHGRFREVVEERARAAGFAKQSTALKLGAPATLMKRALEQIRDRHGSAAAYLQHHGLPPDALERLRSVLVVR